MPRKKKTEYEKLVQQGLIQSRRGEAVMSLEERKERRQAQTRLMMEARRRAERVVVTLHKEEFDLLYAQEKQALRDDPRYTLPER